MTNFSMRGSGGACGGPVQCAGKGTAVGRLRAAALRWSRYDSHAAACRDFARGGLVPADRVGAVAVAAPPLPLRGGLRCAPTPQARRRRRGAVGRHRPAARRRLRAPPRHGRRRRPPAHDHGRARAPRRGPRRSSARSPRTPTSSASRATAPMERTLFAVDELSGFVVACAAVRPEGIHGLTPKSVKKKLKQPSFAAAVNRDDVRHGAEELGVDFDEHVRFVVAALEAARRRARSSTAAPPRRSAPPGMYGQVLRAPHVRALVAFSVIARVPLGITSIALVLFVRQQTGSFASAGVVTATFALSSALLGVAMSRLIDRHGQTLVLLRRHDRSTARRSRRSSPSGSPARRWARSWRARSRRAPSRRSRPACARCGRALLADQPSLLTDRLRARRAAGRGRVRRRPAADRPDRRAVQPAGRAAHRAWLHRRRASSGSPRTEPSRRWRGEAPRARRT